MTEQAMDFVDQWADNNVHAEGVQAEEDTSEAERLADQCVAAAGARGISKESIEDSVGDIVDYMASALKRANDDEVNRLSLKDH